MMSRKNAGTGKLRQVLAVIVTLAVGMGQGSLPVWGQIAQTTSQLGPKSLHIDILEGEGASNNIRQRDAREPVIQVTDENHKPVSGVAVVFLIHNGNSGASASFAGQSQTFTATTGPDGIVKAQGLTVGQAPGSFTIAVSATLGAVAAQAVIHQANVISALGSTSASSAATHAGTVAQHGAFHIGRTALLAAGGTAVVGTVVIGVVALTKANNSGTSLVIGTGKVGP